MRSMSMYDEKGNLNEDNINALFGSKANLEYLA
jgi:hypothetical protein